MFTILIIFNEIDKIVAVLNDFCAELKDLKLYFKPKC